MPEVWDEETGMGHSEELPDKEKPKPLSVKAAGEMGQVVYNDLVSRLTYLQPVKGRLTVTLFVEVSDDRFLGPDESARAQIVVDVELGKR